MASSKNKNQTQLFEIGPIMESTSQSDHETYRAVVLRQHGNEVLLALAEDGFCLPWVEVPRRADAYVGNPLFSLQYLSQHCRRLAAGEPAIESGLTGAYVDQWRSLVSRKSFAEAMAVAPLLAVFAYALASDTWNDSARLQDPEVTAYLRSLTRPMHSEATRLRDRRALCPIHRRSNGCSHQDLGGPV